MARFKIISKNGRETRYEGKPRYNGSYLKPSYLEFAEIASPTPIKWEVGDYVDYPRTGMRYKLYSIPQPSKNAKRDTDRIKEYDSKGNPIYVSAHGRAFVYSNVQLFASTKDLEIAPFRDLVGEDNYIHFSTSPDVATYEDVYGIARRIQACMNDLYPGKWLIRVADFDAYQDAEILEVITTAKDFAMSGGTCLDALSKIYELWQDIGWVHSYDSSSGMEIITIGYANKRVSDNTTDAFLYGKGNGLTAIKKNQTNKDEFATRLYIYGSDRNLPARYYNNLGVRNAESVDIRNLMIPLKHWGRTGGLPDASKAYIENSAAVAKYGVIPKTHYFDSSESGADIYPSIERMTIGDVRNYGDGKCVPDYSIYPNPSERVDEIGEVVVFPDDNGVMNQGGDTYGYSKKLEFTESSMIKTVPGILTSIPLLNERVIYKDVVSPGFYKGEVILAPNLSCKVADVGFISVTAKVTLGDSLEHNDHPDIAVSKRTYSVVATQDETTKEWVINLGQISAKYEKAVYEKGFPIYYFISITAERAVEIGENKDCTITFQQGDATLNIKKILDKTFTIRLKQIGFNINDKAAQGDAKVISMRSGGCQGRDFVISSCVYVPWLDSWDITLKRQQDDTLGMLFPNNEYPISAGERFVLLGIQMPELYIHANMDRLYDEGVKLLERVSKVQNHYEPSIDAKVMAESGKTIREGMFMEITDEDVIDNKTDYILIDTLSIYEDESSIPTYKVTLRERRKVTYKGTPSATSSTSTRSVVEDSEPEEVKIDLSEYAKKEELKPFEDISKMFVWDDEKKTTIRTKYNLIVEGDTSSGAAGSGTTNPVSGTVTGIHIDGKPEYKPNSLGIIDLTSAFEGISVDVDLTDYYTKNEVNELLDRISAGDIDLANYYTKQEIDDRFNNIDLSNFYTKGEVNSLISSIDLSSYLTDGEAEETYAKKSEYNQLRQDFNSLYNLLNDDTSAYINTWNEVVSFLDGYKDEQDLAAILAGMNNEISDRLLVSEFDTYTAGIASDISNLQSVIAEESGRIDSNEGDIRILYGYFTNGVAKKAVADGNGKTIATYYTPLSSHKELADRYNAFVESIGESIGALEEKDAALEGKDKQILDEIAAIQADITNNIVGKLDSNENDIETLKSYFTKDGYANRAVADAAGNVIGTYYTPRTTFEGFVTETKDAISKLPDYSEEITSLQELTSAQGTQIESNKTSIEGFYNRITSIEPAVANNAASIISLTGRIEGIDSTILALQGMADDLSDNFSALEATVSTFSSSIDELLSWKNNANTILKYFSYDSVNGAVKISTNLIVTGDTASGSTGSITPSAGTVTGIYVDGNTYGPNALGIVDISRAFEGLDVSLSWSEIQGRPTDLGDFTNNAGYATQSWVLNETYAQESWVNSNFLAKAGGTITGSLTINSSLNVGNNIVGKTIYVDSSAAVGIYFASGTDYAGIYTHNKQAWQSSAARLYSDGSSEWMHDMSIFGGLSVSGDASVNSITIGGVSITKYSNGVLMIDGSVIITGDTASGEEGNTNTSTGGISAIKVGSVTYGSAYITGSVLNLTTLFNSYATDAALSNLESRVYALESTSGGGIPSLETLTFSAGTFSAGSYDGTTAKTISIPTSYTHIGLGSGSISLNGSSSTYATISGNAGAKSFYAPTSPGTSGYILQSNGSGAPQWVAPSSLGGGITESDVYSIIDSYNFIDQSTALNYLAYYLPLGGGVMTGNLYFDNGLGVRGLSSGGADLSLMEFNTSNALVIGWDVRANSFNTLLCGNIVRLYSKNGEAMRIDTNGNVGIGTTTPNYKLHVSGSIYATGSVTQGSDMRFKEVLENKTLSIESIAEAPLFLFRWNDFRDYDIHLGTSAQYWKVHASWLTQDRGNLGLEYSTLGVAMGISIAKRVITHEEKIKMLESRVKTLESRE